MINAELSHNPYLLQTTAQFNGRAPMVNSAIEKFEARPLVEWAGEVPRIFRHEMNGLDFDFFFSGTDSDYQKVVAAFREQGIGEDDVRIGRKGELEDVVTKRREIENLVKWLGAHRNRRFDYDAFMNANSDTLDASASYVIVQEDPVELDLPYVSVQAVDDALDLEGIELTSIPVLLTVSRSNRRRVREELQYILSRRDIELRQLFFLIHPAMNKERVIRIISDLGVEDPQVVDAPDDARIVKYLEDFPAMDYARRCIRILRSEVNGVGGVLQKYGRFREATSAGTREEIASFESQLQGLADALVRMEEEGSYVPMQQFSIACNDLLEIALTWRNKKVSVSGKDQILRAALDYEADLRIALQGFESRVASMAKDEAVRIEGTLLDIYRTAGNVPDFSPDAIRPYPPAHRKLPVTSSTFMELTEITYVSTKADFFGFLGAFAEQQDEKKPVEMATFETWRATAREALMPMAREIIESHEAALSDYQASLIEEYTRQLEELVRNKKEAKERVSSKLSDTERELQEDKDWLAEFDAMLTHIERS